MTTTENWTHTEFMAFIMVFAAASDMEINDEELDTIREKVGAEATASALKTLDQLNDKQRIDLILSYQEQYFPTPEKKQEVLDTLKRIFVADHAMDMPERETLMMLRKLL